MRVSVAHADVLLQEARVAAACVGRRRSTLQKRAWCNGRDRALACAASKRYGPMRPCFRCGATAARAVSVQHKRGPWTHSRAHTPQAAAQTRAATERPRLLLALAMPLASQRRRRRLEERALRARRRCLRHERLSGAGRAEEQYAAHGGADALEEVCTQRREHHGLVQSALHALQADYVIPARGGALGRGHGARRGARAGWRRGCDCCGRSGGPRFWAQRGLLRCRRACRGYRRWGICAHG